MNEREIAPETREKDRDRDKEQETGAPEVIAPTEAPGALTSDPLALAATQPDTAGGTGGLPTGVPVNRPVTAGMTPVPSTETTEAFSDDGDGRAGVRMAGAGRSGVWIGPYRLIEVIGEGGMGVVYRAEQERPVRRQVALKIIRPGMDSEQIVARFEAERQALALMDHPNIARVFDAGTTAMGRPYFAMELVEGVPITDYCDRERLPVRERLELFVPVCRAIQHAHQKGIIHRDVKPTNILVTPQDGRPVPRVIDFGIAKATQERLTDRTLVTLHGAIVGTLEYMSPEQAGPADQDIDTRSDIYALGILLYELLTGSTPLDRARLRRLSYPEALRRVHEEEPTRPSSRLSGADEALATLAEHRRAEPDQLIRQVRGELDWIVMKALEKDRARRYQTANGLARDVERHLHDEPVEACPPSATYRLRKFARRHRVFLASSAAFGALLVLGAALSTWEAIRATRAERAVRAQRDVANAARDAEARSRLRAEAAERVARRERDRAVAARREADRDAATTRAINDFLQSDLLAQASVHAQARPNVHPDPDIKVRTLLDRASERIGGKFAGQPLVEASIRQTIGEAYWGLGLYRKAQAHEERALELRRRILGNDHPATLRTLNHLAYAYWYQARWSEAEALLVEALEASRRVLGAEAPLTLDLMLNLASVYRDHGKLAEAEPLLVQGLEIERRLFGESHPATLAAMQALAVLYRMQGRLSEAEPLQAQALEDARRTLGAEDPMTLSLMTGLARVYQLQGRLSEAEPLLVEALEGQRRILGAEHLRTYSTMNRLALLYRDRGRIPEAKALLARVLEGRRRVRGAEHMDTQATLGTLALLLTREPQSQPRASAAGPGSDLAYWGEIAATLGDAVRKKPDDPTLRHRLALALLMSGDRDGYRRAVAEMRERFAHARAGATSALARACLIVPDPSDDLSLPRQWAETEVASNPEAAWCYYTLGLARYRVGDDAGAIRSLERSMEIGPRWKARALDWVVLAMAHQRLGHRVEARRWLDRTHDPRSNAPSLEETWYARVEFLFLRREADALFPTLELPDDPFQR